MNALVKPALGHLTSAHGVSKWPNRLLQISKEWQTMASNHCELCAEGKAEKPLPQGQYWSHSTTDKEPMGDKVRAKAVTSWHRGAFQSGWFIKKMTSYPVYDCPSSQLQSPESRWMNRWFNSGWKSFDLYLIKHRSQKGPGAAWYNLDLQSGSSNHSTWFLSTKAMSQLFRLHLSERAMFDERTAVIVGDRRK